MAIETSTEWIENKPSRGFRALSLGELWRYRELVYFLALRDVKSRYKQTALGLGWAFVQPILSVAALTFVFRRIANVSSQGIPYPVFALAGFLAWNYFAGIVGGATSSVVANYTLVTKVYFPRLAAPASALLPGLLSLVPGVIVLAALMAWKRVAPGPAVAALPLCLLALVATGLGVGLLLATLNVRYRDVGGAIGTLMQLWLLASPVAYSATALSGAWRWVYALNPMTGIIEGVRWSVIRAPAPGPEVALSAVVAVLCLLAGLAYFQRSERRFADVI